jgi:hypothetical protein
MKTLPTHLQELVVGAVDITLSIGHLQDVVELPPVCSILGMSNNKEDEVDTMEVSHLGHVSHTPQHMMVLVLSRTVLV